MIDPEPCRWVDHRGTRILVVTYSGCVTDREMLAVLGVQVQWMKEAAAKVRVISDFRKASVGPGFLEEAKRLSRERREVVIEKAAVVGLARIQKALFTAYKLASGDHTSHAFSTMESALDWVAPGP